MIEPRIVCTASDIGEERAGIPGIEITPGGRVFVVCFPEGSASRIRGTARLGRVRIAAPARNG